MHNRPTIRQINGQRTMTMGYQDDSGVTGVSVDVDGKWINLAVSEAYLAHKGVTAIAYEVREHFSANGLLRAS